MDIVSLALSRPKTIKLQDYTYGEETLEFAILFAYMNGGGAVQADLDERFWKDVDTKRPLRFVWSSTAYNGTLVFNNVNLLYEDGVIFEVTFEFSAVTFGKGERIQIVIMRHDGKTAALSVKVDTVEYPTT